MGFLSRKSKPEPEPPQLPEDEGHLPEDAAQPPRDGAVGEVPIVPDHPEQELERATEDGGEIKISRGSENGTNDLRQVAHQAVPTDAALAAPVQTEAPPVEQEVSPGPMRLRPDEVIAPTRHPAPEQKAEQAQGAKVISFANQKGGVAKTTTTLNLAVAFAESGYRVLCIDLDPQGNLTMSQGIDPDKVETSLYDVLVHDVPMTEAIAHREIDIAVASIDLAGAEIAMSTKIGRERSLEKALKPIRGDYDFVCIDTPPSLGLLTINALTASDKVIVPVQCEYLSMRGLVQLQNTLKMIQENLNPDVEIEGILPTMLDSRTVHAKEAVEILEENFGDLVFKSRIRKAIKFAEAPVRGASVLKYDPDSNAANYYRELAKEVLDREPAKEVLTNGSS
jgi:chromosome partitioning protein